MTLNRCHTTDCRRIAPPNATICHNCQARANRTEPVAEYIEDTTNLERSHQAAHAINWVPQIIKTDCDHWDCAEFGKCAYV